MTNYADNRKSKNDYLLSEIEFETYHEVTNPDLNKRYWKLKDSLDRIRDWKISRLRGYGESISTVFIGVNKIYECDSCNSFDIRKFGAEYKTKYFIRLNGYTLEDDAIFFIRKDKYYIRYTVLDRIQENGNKVGHFETKETQVRYTTGSGAGLIPDGALLIPVSKQTYRFLNIVVWVLTAIFLIFFFFTLFALPAKTLFSIATGAPFTKQNIKRLLITGWTLICIPVLPPLTSLLVKWILGDKIPSEIYYPFFQSILDNRTFLIAGLIVLLIANAFKRGYKLQQEQELTV